MGNVGAQPARGQSRLRLEAIVPFAAKNFAGLEDVSFGNQQINVARFPQGWVTKGNHRQGDALEDTEIHLLQAKQAAQLAELCDALLAEAPVCGRLTAQGSGRIFRNVFGGEELQIAEEQGNDFVMPDDRQQVGPVERLL
jgi:hypothetical protein